MKLEGCLPQMHRAWLFTHNEKDGCQLTSRADMESAAPARDVENVAVKPDVEDAMYIWSGRVSGERAAAPDIASDALLGGLVYGLAGGWSLNETFCLANYTEATATTAIGCLTARSSMVLWRNRRNA